MGPLVGTDSEAVSTAGRMLDGSFVNSTRERLTWAQKLMSEITRTVVLYVYMFEAFIAFESHCRLINSFHKTVETQTTLPKENMPPLSYNDKMTFSQ